MISMSFVTIFFFFNDTATTEIYTLSLHDALPISVCHRQAEQQRSFLEHQLRSPGGASRPHGRPGGDRAAHSALQSGRTDCDRDRKSTRLNSSHANISYAVFCLKKKKKLHCNVSNS